MINTVEKNETIKTIIKPKYFDHGFKDEDFNFLKFIIKDNIGDFLVRASSYDKTHISSLFLDRIIQSISFIIMSVDLLKSNKKVRYFFLDSMSFKYKDIIKPSRDISIKCSYSKELLEDRKITFKFSYNINDNKVTADGVVNAFI